MKSYMKEYYYKHNRKDYFKEYFHKEENKKKKDDYMKEYHSRPEVKEHKEEYRKEYISKPEKKLMVNKNGRERRKRDFKFKISCNLRCLLSNAFKLYSKTGKIMSSKKYGIDYKAIIEHLKPFPPNIKEYHIDHIIPLSLFDFNNPIHIKKAFLPHNHQWLKIKDNLEKNNRLVMPH